LPEGCSLHVIVYAVPSRLSRLVLDALMIAATDWTADGRAKTGEAGGRVAYFDAPGRISVEPKLADWV